MNWNEWHIYYDSLPNLQERLRIVRDQIVLALDEFAPGPIQIVSICAGDGRDLIGALKDHPRRGDVTALLLDNNPKSIERGKVEAAKIGLTGNLRFIEADATLAKNYLGGVPADLVLLSGFFGHLRHADVPFLINALPMFCKSGGQVIWNRHLVLHNGRDQVPLIREHFLTARFPELQFETTDPKGFATGRVRFEGQTEPLDPSRVLFEFIGLDRLLSEESKKSVNGAAKIFPAGNAEILPEAETSIPARFKQIAGSHSGQIAIAGSDWLPTYAELDGLTDRLASTLISKGGKTGDRVALLMSHDAPMIAASLAVLKAGRIVVVLNQTDPPARIKKILDDAEADMIVTDLANENLAKEMAQTKLTVLCFENLNSLLATDSAINIQPTDIAWLIYTSGTTGQPKGVIQTHRNIVHNVMRLSRGMELSAQDRIVLLASPSGGLGVATTWCALLTGATLVPFSITDNGVSGLKKCILKSKTTVLVFSASVFRSFVKTLTTEDVFPEVRLIRIGSETARTEDFAAFKRHFTTNCILLNSLSSSETGNITQQRFAVSDNPAGNRLPVGKPSHGIEIFLLDDNGMEVQVGETGEIVVRSCYLSPGYWRNDGLTAARFSQNGDEARIFYSGDLGCRLADGTLVFMDRKDARIKMHGYRVELTEIEDALLKQPGVESALVSARTATSGETQLVAHVVLSNSGTDSAETLRQRLRAVLPGYMVPAHFLFMEKFPLTTHGKIDRNALPQPEDHKKKLRPGDLPRDMIESRLTQIWESAIGISPIGRRDDFFELGGTSLQSVEILLHIEQAFEVSLPPSILSDGITIEKLASTIGRMK